MCVSASLVPAAILLGSTDRKGKVMPEQKPAPTMDRVNKKLEEFKGTLKMVLCDILNTEKPVNEEQVGTWVEMLLSVALLEMVSQQSMVQLQAAIEKERKRIENS